MHHSQLKTLNSQLIMKIFKKNLLPGTLRRHAGYWRAIETVQDLAVLLDMPAHQLQLLSAHPQYKEYKLRKADGSFRQIEDPALELKWALKRINHYLQAAYCFQRPASVHGFCISPRDEEDRNILSNALRHIGQPHLLNMDLEDFFHHVTDDRVHGLLAEQLPGAREDLLALLSRIMTRHGRLPMGAPTSPALSNYACLGLDADLEALAGHMGLVYTRFADDLSYSGAEALSEADVAMLREAIEGHGFLLNEAKLKQYGPQDVKLVTGLVVTDQGVTLPEGYLSQLRVEIDRLRSVLMVDARYNTGMSNRKLGLLKRELRGKLDFARMVLGTEVPEVQATAQAYEDALFLPEEYETANWLEIPYEV